MIKMFIAVLFATNFLIGQDCEEGSQWVETNDGHFECCPSANYMFDCDGNCYHISFYANFLGDGGCNMGKNIPNLNCEDYNLDDGDCIRDEHCGDGEVDDCADDDCCPENWIADGYPDCEDQQWGCDLTCYQNDGGDCGPICGDTEILCWDGSCAASEDSCPAFGCEEGYLPDCSGDEVCCPESLSGCSTSTCDLTCYSEECLTGPDLVVDQATLLNSIYTSTINVSEDDCYIQENCVTGSGLRDLIRFTTEIGNIGNADFYLGPSGSSDDWEWAPCHEHWHFEQYAQYALYSYEETSPGQYDCTDQEIGHKNGWCVMDLADYTNDGTCQFQYGCSNMGISAGCSDIYNSGLDCQWLDITGIPDGEYILSVGTNVNMDHDLIHELNYDNNTANVRITLAGGNVSVGDIFDLNNCNGEVCEEEVDCAGVCGGDAVLSGCDNTCNSTAVVDECGVCDGSGATEVCWDGSNACDIADCPDNPDTVVYSQIQAIFNANCIGCHGGDTPSYELNLESYCNLMVGSDEGSVITPGNHTTSVLWESVDGNCTSNDDVVCMPFTNSLDQIYIDLIAAWIDQGAEDDGSTGGDIADVCGVCGGDGTSCQDCNGMPNGDAVPDCAGNCGGNAAIDECGICVPEGGTPCIIQVAYSIESAFPNLSFTNPVGIYHAGDGTDRLFVVEQIGKIQVFNNYPATSSINTFLDITNIVNNNTNEEGLLGLTFHPNYTENGYIYVNYTDYSPKRNVIARYQVNPGNPTQADGNSALIILEVNQPAWNHNGGQMSFGPDGYLYVSFGDGGGAGDTYGNGQDLSTLLGSIIRIDVDNPSGELNYGIPPDNPFISTSNAEDEIYAYGLRNMWRFSFDPVTDLLWGGDVGQNAWEEIDIIYSGLNYGWNTMEGNHCYSPSTGCNQTGLEPPVFEYSLAGSNCAITGGFVYRGNSMPSLFGKYVYGDYCSGDIWAFLNSGTGDDNQINEQLVNTNKYITSFGLDQNNELLICATDGKIYKLTSDEQSDCADIDADDICDDVDDCVGAYDECGACNGDNADDLGCGCFEPGPSGCDNECGSTLENDECGVCGGDGTSCQQLGDINGDGSLDVIDVVIMINLILEEDYEVIADMNEDGQLDVLDVVILINDILNP